MKKGGKMATVRQIAKLADVSPATVSRVLNNYEHVRPDVRERVIRTARELGGFRDSRNIAVLIASDGAFWSYSGIMLSALLAELKKRRYHEIIVTENSANLLHEHLLDGAISMLLHDGIEQVWDEKQSIPLICINACPRHISGIYSVFSNDRQGVWLALDHLHGLGHIRIAYLANEPRRMLDNSNSGRRLEAYRQWMEVHGCQPVVVQTLEQLDDAIRREKLTAVFSVGEMNGLLTWSHLRNAGWRIPEDLSLVCFKNPSIVLEGLPELTSIEQNYSRMASRVVDQLERLIAGKRIADLEISYRFNPGWTTAPPMR